MLCRSIQLQACTSDAPRPQIDADPDYDLMASLGSVPQLRGSRRGPPPPSAEELAEELEQLRGQALASGMVSKGMACQCLLPSRMACKAAFAAKSSQGACSYMQHPSSPQTDEDFDAAKAEAIPRIRAEWAAAVAPVLPDHLARAARLQKMLDRALPRDHPNYRSAQEKIAVLQVGGLAGCW